MEALSSTQKPDQNPYDNYDNNFYYNHDELNDHDEYSAMKKLLILIVLLWTAQAQAATDLFQAWPYITDSPTITVTWSGQEGAVRHDVKMISKFPTQEWTQTVTGLTATFTMPRTGFYTFAVRACPATGDCTAWSNSDGVGSVVTGAGGTLIAQPWIVYRRLAAPIPH